MATCPNCGSDRFQYQLRSGGTYGRASHYRYHSRNSFFIPSGSSTYDSERKHISVGFCPDCGYMQEPEQEQKHELDGPWVTIGGVVAWLIFAVICWQIAKPLLGLLLIVGFISLFSKK